MPETPGVFAKASHSMMKGMFSPKALAGGFVLSAGIAGMTAPRGHVLSETMGNFIGPLLMTAAGAMIPGVGTFTSFALPMFSGPLNREITKSFQAVADLGSTVGHIGMGGDLPAAYMTRSAVTMRMRAAQELSSSLFNARRQLGMEAALMHE